MTFKEWLLKTKHVTGSTADLYDRWASLYRSTHGEKVTLHYARRWLVSVSVRGKVQPHAVTALKQYCAWLIKTGIQRDAPYSLLSKPKSSHARTKPANIDIVEKHITAQNDSHGYIQGRAAVMLMYSAMVRPVDVLSLSWDKVDFYSGSINIGGTWRAIHKTALDALADWYRVTPARGPFVPVFTSGGGMLSSSTFIDIVHQVDKNLTPHSVRECAILAMLRNGASIESVAQLSGLHVSSVARRVGGDISPDRLRTIYMRAHEHAEAE